MFMLIRRDHGHWRVFGSQDSFAAATNSRNCLDSCFLPEHANTAGEIYVALRRRFPNDRIAVQAADLGPATIRAFGEFVELR